MLIADIYDPQIQQGSAEENIIPDVKDFYDEIRRIIFDTKLVISPLKTVKGKGRETTGAWHLAESLNDAFEISLKSCGWHPLQSPGAKSPQSLIDWFKSKPSGRRYGAGNIGLGLEIQFGNNYQFNEDIKRLSEANLAGFTVAGISIVASDKLAEYKADRGACFSDAKSKLDRHLESLASAGARRFPPIMIIAIENDAFNNDPCGYFEITPVKISRDQRNIIESTSETMITNERNNVIVKRRAKARIKQGLNRFSSLKT
jgi:hypothetical protein